MPDPDEDGQRRAAKRKSMSKKLAVTISLPGAGPVRDEKPGQSDYMNYGFTEPMSSGIGDHGSMAGRNDFVSPRISIDSEAVSMSDPRSERRPMKYEDPRYIDRRRPR